MKIILFIRHAETTKNLNKEFSKEHKEDELTSLGIRQAEDIVNFITQLQIKYKICPKRIYSSTSFRAVDTGNILANHLGLPLKTVEGMVSFSLGSIGGLSEKETAIKYPIFYRQLRLYRNGLLNSYDIDYPEDAELPLKFEERVEQGIIEVMKDETENLKIVILHRSVLTATYIYFARKYQNYPKDFYGFVPIDNGGVTMLQETNGSWGFSFVNENPQNIDIL